MIQIPIGWVLEATVETQAALRPLFDQVVAGACFQAADLPPPTEKDRKPPEDEEPLFAGQENLVLE